LLTVLLALFFLLSSNEDNKESNEPDHNYEKSDKIGEEQQEAS
jgi:hypothetical protein